MFNENLFFCVNIFYTPNSQGAIRTGRNEMITRGAIGNMKYFAIMPSEMFSNRIAVFSIPNSQCAIITGRNEMITRGAIRNM